MTRKTSATVMLLSALIWITAAVSVSAQQPWMNIPSPVTSDLTTVDFVSDQIGYIASRDGEILRTTDGGLNWTVVSQIENLGVTSIDFIDPAHGWVSGNFNVPYDTAGIFETLDSGKTWIKQFNHIFYNFEEVQFLDDSTGWLAASEISESDTVSSLMYTTTRGFSWTKAPSPQIHNALYGIHMRDDDNGIAFGDQGIFFETTNGGMHPDGNWGMNIAIPAFGNTLYGGASSGATYGCVVGEDGFVLVTNNNWSSYQDHTVTSGDTLNSITGLSSIPKFYAVGNNGCIATIQYALFMWMINEETRVTPYHLNDICQVNDQNKWVVGDHGTILLQSNNYPPVAVDDVGSVRQDSSLKIFVLDNDTDMDFDPLEIYDYRDGNHGVLVHPDGEDYLEFYPDDDYVGMDTMWYVVTDGKLGFDTAHIYVEIREVPPGIFKAVDIPHDTVAFGNAIWGDINGDRYYDMIVCGEQPDGTRVTSIYINNEGTFEKADMELEGMRPGNDHAMAFTDLTRNGTLDFIITGVNESGDPATLLYIFNPFAASYKLYQTDIPGVKNGSVDWGDYDRDGDPDLLISGNTGTEKICRIYRNDGIGEEANEWIFTDAHVNFHGLDYGAARFIDFNHDQYIDVVSAGSDRENAKKTYYYTNLEGLYVVGTLDGVSMSMIDFCDYNNDGNYEILFSGIGEDGLRHTEIYTYDGAFNKLTDPVNGLSSGSVAWGDFDNDGDYDLVMCGMNDQLGTETQLYINIEGTLEQSGEFLPGMASGTVEWGDYDADGDLDLLMSGYFNTAPHRITRIFSNTLEVENARPNPPSGFKVTSPGLNVNGPGALALLSWSPAADTETASEGITYHMTIMRKKNHVKQVLPVSNAEDFAEVSEYGNVADTAVLLNSLEPGGLYYCRLQSVDAGYHVSDLAEFVFNAPTVFFEEQDFNFNGTSLTTAAYFRDDNNAIPKLLLSLSDHPSSHLLQWSGSEFDTLSTDFGPGSGKGQLELLDFNTDNIVDFSEYVHTDSTIIVYVTGVDTLTVETGIDNASYDWGDYDRDGDPDLIVTGNITPTSHLTKLYRNMDGELVFYNTLIPGVQEGDIAWVDFDGDGDDDVAVTGYNGELQGITRFYENRGGGFIRKTMDLPGLYFSSFDFADRDGDGDVDMLICGVSDDGPHTMIYNNNDGIYIPTTYHLDHVMQGTCKWADLYADGKSDIILLGNPEDQLGDAKYTGIVYAYYDGDYVEVARMKKVPGPIISLGDFDGNKSLDFAFAGSPGGDSRIWLYRNKTISGGGAKGPPRNLNVSCYGDSVMLSWDHPASYQHGYENLSYNIRLGTESGTGNILSPLSDNSGLRKVFQYGNVPFGTSKMIHGLSGDSTYYASVQAVRPSFMGSEFTNEMVFNPKSGSMIPVAIYQSNRTIRNAEWVDIDSDGDPDLLMDVINTIVSYENDNGVIDFSERTTHIDFDFADELMVNDFDNDNDPDILLISSTNPTINKLLENESGVFSSTDIDPQGLFKADAAWGELDNDGHPDLLISGMVTHNEGMDTYVYAWRDGVYESLDNLLVPTYAGEVHWVDIDNDGDRDLVRFGLKEDVHVTEEDFVLLINKNIRGAFDIVEHDLPGLNYGNIDFGDYDNDGDPDMLYTGSDPYDNLPRSYICKNTGGNFEITDSITPLFNASAKWADLDNDGLLDIVVSGYNDEAGNVAEIDVNKFTGIFLNRGGSFEEAAELKAFRVPVVAVADYDGDGRQDIFVGGYSNTSDTLGVLYRNMFPDINTPPSAPYINSVLVSTDSAEINWLRAQDSDAADNMLYFNLRVGTTPGAGDVVSPLALADGTRMVQGMGNVQQSTSYAVRRLEPATTYYAAVQAIDKGMGASAWSDEEEFTTLGTGTAPAHEEAMDIEVYPVPTKEQLNIRFPRTLDGLVVVQVFDQTGRLVKTLDVEDVFAGKEIPISLPGSGIYMLRVISEDAGYSGKVVVIE